MRKVFLLFALFFGFITFAQAQSHSKELFTAVIKNKPADADALLTAGADANAPVEMMPGFPTTFLIMAAGSGHLEVVKALVKHKAQVDKPDSFQATALMAAAANGSLEVVAFLLANGANPRAKDKDGKDVLASAKEGGNAQVIALIEQKLKAS
ncbi:ankyrin repeat domain-containing protein [Hymenobacter lutimineralis]|uniref:Ankyrin repeat domain-containing protein n=1 Tax=Hymenobacter lutimineralis TaxID=2606448 RepID=A0A5D6VGA2_9BACT|nr:MULTISPECIES: ankyrin repeat domain-containing protein [Hymenobacter]QIX60111.1 ankyrin repeat domain-containing protein [Hymenobacter sp. BT18]TYZ14455.1 ankyrin repeat domain-containing protein [Hymenobacter lutimineralis]